MPASMHQATLPNGTRMFHRGKTEFQALVNEIPGYFAHGIRVEPGDTVFDVGANIGMFTRWTQHLCDNQATVYAFEPLPPIFEVLQRNCRSLPPDRIRLFPCGLSRANATATFAYYPHMSVLSTAYPDQVREGLREHRRTMLRNADALSRTRRHRPRLPGFVRAGMLNLVLKYFLRKQEFDCALRTLSGVVREYGVERIDLLKVDVEMGEWDVLLGIDAGDWPKIRQIIAEVHDVDGRLDAVSALLGGHGLEVVSLDQRPLFKDCGVYTLYALRPQPGG